MVGVDAFAAPVGICAYMHRQLLLSLGTANPQNKQKIKRLQSPLHKHGQIECLSLEMTGVWYVCLKHVNSCEFVTQATNLLIISFTRKFGIKKEQLYRDWPRISLYIKYGANLFFPISILFSTLFSPLFYILKHDLKGWETCSSSANQLIKWCSSGFAIPTQWISDF